jgi:probable phosphoglycerate mutase
MPVLYFIRHGETDWNAEGRLQGQTEIPLNARGRRQAAGLAASIMSGRLEGVDRARFADLPIYSSPMERARQTLDILMEALGARASAPQLDDRLKEIGFGRWEGRTWREIVQAEPDSAAERERNKWNFVPPGGESYADVERRVLQWHQALEGDAILVAHGGIARVLLRALARLSPERAAKVDIWQGKLLEIREGRHDWRPGPGHLEV